VLLKSRLRLVQAGQAAECVSGSINNEYSMCSRLTLAQQQGAKRYRVLPITAVVAVKLLPACTQYDCGL
jgi:hypothetical protein